MMTTIDSSWNSNLDTFRNYQQLEANQADNYAAFGDMDTQGWQEGSKRQRKQKGKVSSGKAIANGKVTKEWSKKLASELSAYHEAATPALETRTQNQLAFHTGIHSFTTEFLQSLQGQQQGQSGIMGVTTGQGGLNLGGLSNAVGNFQAQQGPNAAQLNPMQAAILGPQLQQQQEQNPYLGARQLLATSTLQMGQEGVLTPLNTQTKEVREAATNKGKSAMELVKTGVGMFKNIKGMAVSIKAMAVSAKALFSSPFTIGAAVALMAKVFALIQKLLTLKKQAASVVKSGKKEGQESDQLAGQASQQLGQLNQKSFALKTFHTRMFQLLQSEEQKREQAKNGGTFEPNTNQFEAIFSTAFQTLPQQQGVLTKLMTDLRPLFPKKEPKTLQEMMMQQQQAQMQQNQQAQPQGTYPTQAPQANTSVFSNMPAGAPA